MENGTNCKTLCAILTSGYSCTYNFAWEEQVPATAPKSSGLDTPGPAPGGIAVPFGAVTNERGFEMWAEMLAPIFDVEAPRDVVSDFAFGIESWTLGSAVIGRCQAPAHAFDRSRQTIARSGIDHVMIQFHSDGGLVGDFEGRSVHGSPGDICVFDLARPARTVSPDFRNTTLVVPRSMLEPLVADYDGLHGLVLPAENPRIRLLRRHIEELTDQIAGLGAEDLLALVEPTVHLAAACLGTSADGRMITAPAVDRAKLAAVRSFIERHLADPALDAEMICRQMGLSRSVLYRLFEPLGSVAAHIRQRRLNQCLRELVSPRHRARRISEIAFGWGFTNEASFSRAFRQAFDVSPSDARLAGELRLRRRLRDDGPADGTGALEPETALADWMIDLMRV